jgi:hypothetical protein
MNKKFAIIMIISFFGKGCGVQDQKSPPHAKHGNVQLNIFLDKVEGLTIGEQKNDLQSFVRFPLEIRGDADSDRFWISEKEYQTFFPDFLQEWSGRELVPIYFEPQLNMTKSSPENSNREAILKDLNRIRSGDYPESLKQFNIGQLVACKSNGAWMIVAAYSDWKLNPRADQ